VNHLAYASIRSLPLALAAGLALLPFRRRLSASLAHAVWMAVICGMPLLLAFASFFPRIPARIVPPKPGQAELSMVVSAAAQSVVPIARTRTEVANPLFRPIPPRYSAWDHIALAIYGFVALVLGCRVLAGWLMARRVLGRSVSTGHAGVYQSECIAVPVTFGWVNPRILLPASWRDWDGPTLEMVLEHERSHVRRRDGFTALLARLNRCLFWFHPLAWWLERKLALLAEQACDEACLTSGRERKEYARLLLRMSAAAGRAGGRIYWPALGMASRRGATVERIVRVLDEAIVPKRGVGAAAWLAIAIAGAAAVYAAGSIRIERQPPLAVFEFPRLQSPASPQIAAPQIAAPQMFAQQAPPAQPAQPPAANAPNARNMTVAVSVRDLQDRYVTGLISSDFQVLEDGVVQTVTGFRESPPFALALVLNKTAAELEALAPALASLRERLRPGDELLLIYARGDQPVAAATVEELSAIARAVAAGGSADRVVWADSLSLAGDRLQGLAQPVRALLAFSDPVRVDASAHSSEAETTAKMRDSGVLVYSYQTALGALGFADDATAEVLSRISAELGSRYLLTYTSSNGSQDGSYHQLNVVVDRPNLRVRARGGYYSAQ
jgi:BlaR1 peptidase M56